MRLRHRRATRAAEPPGGGRCPLCDELLGVPPERSRRTREYRPPSLRLEVAGDHRRRDQLAWRLSAVGTRHARTSPVPFVADDVRFVYLLCGNGHYFLEEILLPGAEDLSLWRQHAFVAAIGPVASGKSYLLVRTLNQPLAPSGRDHPNARGIVHVERVGLTDPLESVPKETLDTYYGDTRRSDLHRPIPATAIDDLVPGPILQDFIADEITETAAALQKKVMGRARSGFDRWGMTIRQPIFLRTRKAGQPVLTCVADLAGELFTRNQHGFTGLRTLPMLQHCTELVWVIDPFHSGRRFERFLSDSLGDEAKFHRIVEGSSRPDEARAGDLQRLRDVIEARDEINDRIASEITLDFSSWFSPVGGTLYNLVAITKCDLLELALRERDLGDLGDAGAVLDGIAKYLDYVIDRDYPVLASVAVQELVEYLQVGEFDGPQRDAAQRRRVDQLAAALLDHFSHHERFWSLVHGGGADTVKLTNEVLAAALDEREEVVPSLDEHLAACLQPDGGSRLQMRDLVMSAVGCGVMCGLGHGKRVVALLNQRWRDVRFFLCSPLGTVPSFEAATAAASGPSHAVPEVRMKPSDSEYPKIDDPSAGLTQLQLRILRKALP
ncbi:MAG: hypothetical protein ACRDTC_04145 [Pseudonocardiaceae bacterium]